MKIQYLPKCIPSALLHVTIVKQESLEWSNSIRILHSYRDAQSALFPLSFRLYSVFRGSSCVKWHPLSLTEGPSRRILYSNNTDCRGRILQETRFVNNSQEFDRRFTFFFLPRPWFHHVQSDQQEGHRTCYGWNPVSPGKICRLRWNGGQQNVPDRWEKNHWWHSKDQ